MHSNPSATVSTPTFMQGFISVALVATSIILLTVSSKVQVWLPGTPVPTTLQTLAVLALVMMLPKHHATAAVVGWLMVGVVGGIPVFATPLTGPQVIGSPSAGYLFGMLGATVLITALQPSTLLKRALASLLGLACIYLVGTLGIASLAAVGYIKNITLGNLLTVTVAPFLYADALKVAAAVLLATALPVSSWLKGKTLG